jgi:hypothetical protein
MKRQIHSLIAAVVAAMFGTAAAQAAPMTLVRDTWQDSERATPPAPVYSEAGVDGDQDGDLESAWFNGGEGSVMTASPGNFRLDPVEAPATWTTYFTSEEGAFGLGNLLFTWRFRTGDVSASDTGQNFRIAMVDSFPNTRLTDNGSPPAGSYPGRALFGNMAEVTGHENSFQLRRRGTAPAGPLLEDVDAWSPMVNGLGAGAIGYADDTDYTFTMRIQRRRDGLAIAMTMAGGNLGGTGSVSVNVVDPSPITFTYDTFSIYVGGEGSTASFLDTKLFMVEVDPIPEPASAVLAAVAGLAVVANRRPRRRS